MVRSQWKTIRRLPSRTRHRCADERNDPQGQLASPLSANSSMALTRLESDLLGFGSALIADVGGAETTAEGRRAAVMGGGRGRRVKSEETERTKGEADLHIMPHGDTKQQAISYRPKFERLDQRPVGYRAH